MDLFVYSDESGVFDYLHNDLFVFGGLILLGKEAKEIACRRYIAAEKVIYSSSKYKKGYELKATHITNSEKGKLYRALNSYYKFAVIIREQSVLKTIFDDKKSKQRYLDYAYKVGLKKPLEQLIKKGLIDPNANNTLVVNCDEHTTATNGRYELREALLQEYKIGTYNMNWDHFYPPILPSLTGVNVNYCNSAKQTLVRAADIIANRVFFCALNGKISDIKSENLILTYLP